MTKIEQEATKALVAFEGMYASVESHEDIEHGDAGNFVTANLDIITKLPAENRMGFGDTLPFSLLERVLLVKVRWHEHSNGDPARSFTVMRLQGWLALNSYRVEGRDVTCSGYLRKLGSFLAENELERAEHLARLLE